MNYRHAFAVLAACAAAAASVAAAQDQNVNHHSTRSNSSPQDGDGIAAPGASVSVSLAAVGGAFSQATSTTSGAASFSAVPPGEYALTISPSATPNATITGAELSKNALIACPVPAGDPLVCEPVTVMGTGPQTVTVKLLGKATRAKPNTRMRVPGQTAPAEPKSPQG
jgi:hypothetical protein